MPIGGLNVVKTENRKKDFLFVKLRVLDETFFFIYLPRNAGALGRQTLEFSD